METVVCLFKKEEVRSQQMGVNFSFLIPGFSGSGNDLRIVLSPEAASALMKDMRVVAKAQSIEASQKSGRN